MTAALLHLPPPSALLWADLATGKKTAPWTALPVKIMMTRIRTQIERNPSPANVSERAIEIHEFFEKNPKFAEKDLLGLIG